MIDTLADAALLKYIGIAVFSSIGIFATVVFAGTLSALIALGVFALVSRDRIHRAELQKYCAPINAANRLEIVDFIAQRYAGVPIAQIAAGRYADYLINHNERGDLLPAIMQIPAGTLYRLHHRQICGQLMAKLSTEGPLISGRKIATPLSDVFMFLAESSGLSAGDKLKDAISFQGIFIGPAFQAVDAEDTERNYVETATRQIDVIQANLGQRINTASYSYATVIWIFLYVILLTGAVTGVENVQGFLDYIRAGAAYVVHWLLALFAAIVLGICTGVFSGVAFTWLDGRFTSR
jgi:hypothetical protein